MYNYGATPTVPLYRRTRSTCMGFNTCGSSCLDVLYSNIKRAYRAINLPVVGQSDQRVIAMLPTYTKRLNADKSVIKSLRRWDNKVMEVLKGCFAWIDWSVFESSCTDLDEVAVCITDYINFCVDTFVSVERVKVYPTIVHGSPKSRVIRFATGSLCLRLAIERATELLG